METFLKMKFKIVSQFEKEEDFGGDCIGYQVELDGKVIAEFGDDYHDKGYEKSEAFVEGYCFAKGIKIDVYEDVQHEERAGFSI